MPDYVMLLGIDLCNKYWINENDTCAQIEDFPNQKLMLLVNLTRCHGKLAFIGKSWLPMFCALDSGSSGPGSNAGRGHCVVFLGKTFNSHNAALHAPRNINGYRRTVRTTCQNAGGNLRWTSIPSRG